MTTVVMILWFKLSRSKYMFVINYCAKYDIN